MKVIVFASQKGGVGKSMLCRCLAVAAEKAGDGPVAIIDSDPQGTTSNWFRRREAATPVMLNLRSIRAELGPVLKQAAEAGIAYTLIDTQGALTESLSEIMSYADITIIPVKASPDDIEVIPATLELVRKSGKPFGFVLTQVKVNTIATNEARLVLPDFGWMLDAYMADRTDYARAVVDGRTILETEPNSRGAAEVMEIWESVKDRLNTGRDKKKKGMAA